MHREKLKQVITMAYDPLSKPTTVVQSYAICHSKHEVCDGMEGPRQGKDREWLQKEGSGKRK